MKQSGNEFTQSKKIKSVSVSNDFYERYQKVVGRLKKKNTKMLVVKNRALFFIKSYQNNQKQIVRALKLLSNPQKVQKQKEEVKYILSLFQIKLKQQIKDFSQVYKELNFVIKEENPRRYALPVIDETVLEEKRYLFTVLLAKEQKKAQHLQELYLKNKTEIETEFLPTLKALYKEQCELFDKFYAQHQTLLKEDAKPEEEEQETQNEQHNLEELEE
jgi:hypothetical protein